MHICEIEICRIEWWARCMPMPLGKCMPLHLTRGHDLCKPVDNRTDMYASSCQACGAAFTFCLLICDGDWTLRLPVNALTAS
jgi:hypothetical protein